MVTFYKFYVSGLTYENNIAKLKTRIKLDHNPSGSKSNLKGDFKSLGEQFGALKSRADAIAKKVQNETFEMPLNQRLSLDETVERIQNFAKESENQIFQKLETELKSITAEDLDLDKISDFNPATAIKLLWGKLGIPTEISFKGFKKGDGVYEDLEKFWDGEIDEKEFMNAHADIFVPQFKEILKERFAIEHVDVDRYVGIVQEELSDDIKGLNESKVSSVIRTELERALGEYVDGIENNNNANTLLSMYRSPNQRHERNFLRKTKENVIPKLGAIKADLSVEAKKETENFILTQAKEVANSMWTNFLENKDVQESFNLNLGEKFVDEHLEELYDYVVDTHFNFNDYQNEVANAMLTFPSDFKLEEYFEVEWEKVVQNQETKERLKDTAEMMAKDLVNELEFVNTKNEFALKRIAQAKVELKAEMLKAKRGIEIVDNINEYRILFLKRVNETEIRKEIDEYINQRILEELKGLNIPQEPFAQSVRDQFEVINPIDNILLSLNDININVSDAVELVTENLDNFKKINSEKEVNKFTEKVISINAIRNEIALREIEKAQGSFIMALNDKRLSVQNFEDQKDNLFEEFKRSILMNNIEDKINEFEVEKVTELLTTNNLEVTQALIESIIRSSGVQRNPLQITLHEILSALEGQIGASAEAKQRSMSALANAFDKTLDMHIGEINDKSYQMLVETAKEHGVEDIALVDELKQASQYFVSTLQSYTKDKVVTQINQRLANELLANDDKMDEYVSENLNDWIVKNVTRGFLASDLNWDELKEKYDEIVLQSKTNDYFVTTMNSLTPADFVSDALDVLTFDVLKENYGVDLSNDYLDKLDAFNNAVSELSKKLYTWLKESLADTDKYPRDNQGDIIGFEGKNIQEILDYLIYSTEKPLELAHQSFDYVAFRSEVQKTVAKDVSTLAKVPFNLALNYIKDFGTELYDVAKAPEDLANKIKSEIKNDYRNALKGNYGADDNMVEDYLTELGDDLFNKDKIEVLKEFEAYFSQQGEKETGNSALQIKCQKELEAYLSEEVTETLDEQIPRLTEDDKQSLNINKHIETLSNDTFQDAYPQYQKHYANSDVTWQDFVQSHITKESVIQALRLESLLDNYWDKLENETADKLKEESDIDDVSFWKEIIRQHFEEASLVYHDKMMAKDFQEMFAQDKIAELKLEKTHA